MENRGLISIIIPVYNGEKWLSNAVNSALSQTYPYIEVIIINDGSIDDSLEVCKSFMRDHRVKVLNKANGGQSSARNLGINEAKGEFVQFLDCDDTLEPNACEVAINHMNSETEMVLYGFNIYQFGKLLRTPHCDNFTFRGEYDYFLELSKLLASPCNKLYRRKYIKEEFKENFVYGEDGIFNICNFRKDTVLQVIRNCLYNVHLDNPNSVNKRYKSGRLNNTCFSVICTLEKVQEMYGEEKMRADFLPSKIVTLCFTILLCARKSNWATFIKEMNNAVYQNEKILDFFVLAKGCDISGIHNKLIIRLVNNKLSFPIFTFAKGLHLIKK